MKSILKKKLRVFACLLLLVSFAACGAPEKEAPPTPPNTPTATFSGEGTQPKNTPNFTPDSAANAANTPSAQSNALLAAMRTTTLDGASVGWEDIKGDTLTMLNIWATWCPPCVAELPHLQELSKLYAEQGVHVVGVLQDGVLQQNAAGALDPDQDIIADAKTLLDDAGAAYMVILPDHTIMEEFIDAMQYFPTTFFLDKDGALIETVIGANDTDGWRETIDSILAQHS